MLRCACGRFLLSPPMGNTGSPVRLKDVTLSGGLKWERHTAVRCPALQRRRERMTTGEQDEDWHVDSEGRLRRNGAMFLGNVEDELNRLRRENRQLREWYRDLLLVFSLPAPATQAESFRQPSPLREVQTVVTYGAYEEPI